MIHRIDRRLRLRMVIAGTVLLPALALAYPDRPVRMVLPFPPGGGTDSLARVILPRMGQALGQPIVIDNRPDRKSTRLNSSH